MISTDTMAVPAPTPGLPLIGIAASFPIACFTCALATDIAYMQTAQMMWADFSAWLLVVGLVGAVLAALIGAVLLLVNRRVRRPRPLWPVALGSLAVLVVGFADNLVHSRDAWTSVVPLGLTLSAITVVLMLITAWLGFARISRPALAYSGVRA